LNKKFDAIIENYIENNIGIHKNFLSKTLTNGLALHLQQLLKTEQLHLANIGNSSAIDSNQKFRTDKIHWLDKKNDNVFENEFLNEMAKFITRLNETCYTGINDFEFHFAVYEEGAFYKRHKDQFKNDDHRKFSMVSYLNNDWNNNDCGDLIVYPDGQPQSIWPNAQTTVFFKSNEMEHEVNTTKKQRLSIAGWLKVV
jgi:SM-20-related protein